LLFGIWMLVAYDWAVYANAAWLHAKLALLALTLVYHYFCYQWLLDFKHDRNRRSHVFYRWMNEVPVLFLVSIVILAVVKPF